MIHFPDQDFKDMKNITDGIATGYGLDDQGGREFESR
jgi:hypothetical protein